MHAAVRVDFKLAGDDEFNPGVLEGCCETVVLVAETRKEFLKSVRCGMLTLKTFRAIG